MCSRVFKHFHHKSHTPNPPSLAPTPSRTTTICPHCGFKIRGTSRTTSFARQTAPVAGVPAVSNLFPAGINPAILLDSSPTPQLLLTDNNLILYANRSATRLLGRVLVSDDDPVLNPPPVSPPLRRSTGGKYSWTSAGSPGMASTPDHDSGIEGLHMEDLPMELAQADVRKWITLDQVLKNIKNTMQKQREQDAYGFDASAYSDYYATKDDEDLSNGGDDEEGYARKEKIPVMIIRDDGELLSASLYISIVGSSSVRSSNYIALSIVPKSGDVDAGFNSTVRAPTRNQRTKLSNEVAVGTAGADIVERVAKLKDMILDEMEYAFSCITPDGDVVITNKACRELLGAEVLKSPVGEGYDWISRLDIWRPDFSERLPFQEWCINKVFTKKQPTSSTVGLWQGDTKRIFDLKGTPLWEDPEKKEGLLAGLTVIIEQTERANRENEILRSSEVRKTFLMNLSRGLKAPVAGVVALLELLYEIQTGKEQRMLVRQIFSGVNALLLVINDLIDFNKIEANDLKIDQNTFVLQHLVEDIETLFQQNMAKENVQFLVDMSKVITSAFGDGTKLLLKGDDGKIRRIVINLLSNAFKFTTNGTVSLKVITQKVQKGSLELKFEVKDTGIGISKEHVRRLFLPFKKIVADDISTGHYGTGFGLTIAKSFANLLRGDIGCESTVDKGSTFWFSVPLTRPDSNAQVTIPRREDSLSHSMGVVLRIDDLQSAIRYDVKRKRKVSIAGANVLIVEDNWSHQAVTQKRLEKMGCNVQVAVNGQNAITRMKEGNMKVDIVFMDLQMPLLDGYETTALIRKAADPGLVPYKNVPIVAVTATEMTGDRDRAREAGMNDFTLKPLHNDTLKEIMERFLDTDAATKDFREGGSMQSFWPRVMPAEAGYPGDPAAEQQEIGSEWWENPVPRAGTPGRLGKGS